MMYNLGRPNADSPVAFGGPADLAVVIAEWERLGEEEPWHVDTRRYGTDSLHAAIRAVLDIAAWESADAHAAERLVRAAAMHGEQRRAQGAGDDAVLREYQALRATLWRVRQRSPAGDPATVVAMVRVDVAIGVATTVALRAYHRRELASGTSWAADILQQVNAVSRHLADQFQPGAGA